MYVGYLFDSLRGNQTYKTQSWSQGNGSRIRVMIWKDMLGSRAKAWLHAAAGSLEPIITVTFQIDDYACGIITTGHITTVTVDETTSYDVVKTFTGTDLGLDRMPNETAERHLAVDMEGRFAALPDMGSNAKRWAQHHQVKASKYTGYMRQVIQILLGMGARQASTYETTLIERGDLAPMRFDEDEVSVGPDAEGLGEYTLNKKQISYNYMDVETHGLGWGSDGQCYIIEISTQGMYAMKLPVDPITQTDKGAARVRALYPELEVPDLFTSEGLFDLWGGLPNGEGFPGGPSLQKHVNAGNVVEIIPKEDLADYYAKLSHATGLGWAFAPRSPQAVNTRWDYHESGLKKGYLYMIRWQIGAIEEPEWRPDARALLNKMPFLTDSWRVAKVRRMSTSQIGDVSAELGHNTHQTPPEGFMDFFDDVVVTPPVEASGDIEVLQEGWLYHPSRYVYSTNCLDSTGHPQFKFAEEFFGWNQSFNFNCDDAEPPDRCDTPMWAAWVEDQLFVVNYFWEDRVTDAPEYASRADCQYTGTWFSTAPTSHQVQGNFYSNLFDLRRETRVTAAEETRVTAWWAGTKDYFNFGGFFSTCCNIVRYVYVQEEKEIHQDKGASWGGSIVAPLNERSVLYTATIGIVTDEQTSYHYGEPRSVGTTNYTRYGWLYHWVCHWVGCPGFLDDKTIVDTGGPSCKLKEAVPMDFGGENCFSQFGPPEFPEYMPCIDGTDYDRGDDGECKLNEYYNDSVPKVDGWSETSEPENTVTWETRIWGDTYLSSRTLRKGSTRGPKFSLEHAGIDYWWWLTSPTCNESWYTNLAIGSNHWGGHIVNYMDDINSGTLEHHGKPSSMHAFPGAAFVGYVSQEEY